MTPILLKIVTFLGIAAILIGVVYFISRPPTSTTTPQGSYQQSQDNKVVVNLAQLNNSGESGTATLEEKGGYVVVTLNVKGGKNSVAQPAHFHSGTCPGLGPIKYSLKNIVDGTSVTSFNLTLAQLKKELPLAVNVHESTDNFKNYVACGEISLP